VIGPQTAATAREFGLRVDVQPEFANVPALVDALAEAAVVRAAEEREKAALTGALPAKKPGRPSRRATPTTTA
jgi:uroporphyrinogen III methyltransferase/synthase